MLRETIDLFDATASHRSEKPSEGIWQAITEKPVCVKKGTKTKETQKTNKKYPTP